MADSSDERHVNGLDASHSGDRGQGLLEQVRAAGGVTHDRHREDCVEAEGHGLLAQIAKGASERCADARSNRLEVRVSILGHDPERDGHGSHLAPHGPLNEQAGQRYDTDWSRHRAHRPIFARPQLGHGNTVVPFPERTAPHEVQRLSARITGRGMKWVYKSLCSRRLISWEFDNYCPSDSIRPRQFAFTANFNTKARFGKRSHVAAASRRARSSAR